MAVFSNYHRARYYGMNDSGAIPDYCVVEDVAVLNLDIFPNLTPPSDHALGNCAAALYGCRASNDRSDDLASAVDQDIVLKVRVPFPSICLVVHEIAGWHEWKSPTPKNILADAVV